MNVVMQGRLKQNNSSLILEGTRLTSLLMACLTVGLSTSQTYTSIEAPSGQPRTPVARKLARAYPVATKGHQDLGDGSPFHPVERVLS